jgi:mono/diheme cytochrome c family protein
MLDALRAELGMSRISRIHWLGGWAALVAASLGVAAWLHSWPSPHSARISLARGQQLYAQHCASCHGANLEGQPDWRRQRPDGRLPAPPHDASGHTWHHPDAQLFLLTKHGPAALVPGYQSDMPAFEGILDDAQIGAVLAFIKSTWPLDIRARQEASGAPRQRP